MKIELIDETKYSVVRAEITNGRFEIDFSEMTAEELQKIFSVPGNISTINILTDDDNKCGIVPGWTVYGGIMLNGDIKTIILTKPVDATEKRITDTESAIIELQTAVKTYGSDEVKASVKVAQIQAQSLPDEQALAVKALYKNWEDDPEGYSYNMSNPDDNRRNYNGKLWNLNKGHNKQADWYPGADPALWTEIVEGYAGTLEDPIPVPDSVTTSGFEYEYGKYYQEGGIVYLCKRGGVSNPESMYGQKEKLFFSPSALLDQYFVLAG